MILNPESSRRPDVAGVPVTLADGRAWHLATPGVRFYPKFVASDDPDKPRVELWERLDWPTPEARRRFNTLLDAVCAEDSATFPLALVVDAAIEMLVLCHDVDRESAAELFAMTREEMENLAVVMLRMYRGEGQPILKEQPSEEPKGD